jgi:hypothetical protein
MASSGAALLMGATRDSDVQTIRVPPGGVQPQAVVDSKGVTHLVYLKGDPAGADVEYVWKGPNDARFSEPIRVNDQPGSAIALGTVRGAHIAIGRSDRIHVAWNGSSVAAPKGKRNAAPMLYSRLSDSREKFDRQRNLMTTGGGLDGGGTLAADTKGNVYVTWHAQGQENGMPLEGEGHRRVWLARSANDGDTFEAETAVSPAELGACGCCGMGALTDGVGHLYLLYRTAREIVHRDMYLLISRDQGRTFQAIDLHTWEIGACPMSTVSMALADGRVVLAWETAKQVYFTTVDSRSLSAGKPIAAPGSGNNRKHPTVAADRSGKVLLGWTEGTGWKRGGSLAWQMFDASGQPVGTAGEAAGLPVWDFATAIQVNNRFQMIS